MIAPLCANVHPILDFHTRLVREVKEDYTAGSPFRLVWEGLGENVRWFERIAPALAAVHAAHPVALHLITAIEYRQLAQRFWRRQTVRIAARFADDVRVHQWSEETLSAIATACDLAVIPLPLDRPLERGKPESKLVSFWRMGLPVVTSSTPSYVRAMAGAGQDLHCETEWQWERGILRLIEDERGCASRPVGAGGSSPSASTVRYACSRRGIEFSRAFDGTADRPFRPSIPAADHLAQEVALPRHLPLDTGGGLRDLEPCPRRPTRPPRCWPSIGQRRTRLLHPASRRPRPRRCCMRPPRSQRWRRTSSPVEAPRGLPGSVDVEPLESAQPGR